MTGTTPPAAPAPAPRRRAGSSLTGPGLEGVDHRRDQRCHDDAGEREGDGAPAAAAAGWVRPAAGRAAVAEATTIRRIGRRRRSDDRVAGAHHAPADHPRTDDRPAHHHRPGGPLPWPGTTAGRCAAAPAPTSTCSATTPMPTAISVHPRSASSTVRRGHRSISGGEVRYQAPLLALDLDVDRLRGLRPVRSVRPGDPLSRDQPALTHRETRTRAPPNWAVRLMDRRPSAPMEGGGGPGTSSRLGHRRLRRDAGDRCRSLPLDAESGRVGRDPGGRLRGPVPALGHGRPDAPAGPATGPRARRQRPPLDGGLLGSSAVLVTTDRVTRHLLPVAALFQVALVSRTAPPPGTRWRSARHRIRARPAESSPVTIWATHRPKRPRTPSCCSRPSVGTTA